MPNYRIIDTHAHIFPGKIVEKAVASIGSFYSIPMEGRGTGTDLVNCGKKIGTERYVVHSVATTPRQVRHINDFIRYEMDRHPEFIGFMTLHPFMEGMHEEIERALEMGLCGVKLHPDFQEFNIDDERAMELYRAISGRAILLLHMGDEFKDFSAPRRLARVLDRFADLTVIAAHYGGYHAWEDSRKYLVGRNVYFDTSSSLFMLDAQEAADMMHAHGMDKMLFGTDYPMWLHEEELARFLALPLTEQERKQVLYDNAAALLGISEEA